MSEVNGESEERTLGQRILFGMWPVPLAILITIALVSLVALAVGRAHARDLDGRYAASPLHEWFDHLASGKGLCCSVSDGRALEDPDWESAGDHYRVRIDGAWIDVQDEAVIKEPNRAGKTMVWPYYADGKVLYIRCFLPGSMM